MASAYKTYRCTACFWIGQAPIFHQSYRSNPVTVRAHCPLCMNPVKGYIRTPIFRRALASRMGCRHRPRLKETKNATSKRGLRLLDGEERERLAGFPTGWTAGLSETARARVIGNAVVPQVAEYIGRKIMEFYKEVHK